MAFSTNITTISATGSLSTGEDVYLVDGSISGFTITLPDISTLDGVHYKLRRTDSTANVVTIQGFSVLQTIDGSASTTITAGNTIEAQSFNGVWIVTIDGIIDPVNTSATQTLTNKSLVDASTFIIDDADATKRLQFQVSGVTTGMTRTLTVPNASTTIVGTDATQTLTNKTLTATTNACRATAIGTSGTNVSISTTAPTTGQVLTATSATGANWQTLSSFGGEYQFAESAALSTTNSTSFITKLTLTTASILAGTYKISWFYNWGYSQTNRDFRARVIVDSTTTILTHVQEPKESGSEQRNVVAGFDTIGLTSGVHTIDLDYASSSGGDTAIILNARLDIFRIS